MAVVVDLADAHTPTLDDLVAQATEMLDWLEQYGCEPECIYLNAQQLKVLRTNLAPEWRTHRTLFGYPTDMKD